jgi:hypothetical protein
MQSMKSTGPIAIPEENAAKCDGPDQSEPFDHEVPPLSLRSQISRSEGRSENETAQRAI